MSLMRQEKLDEEGEKIMRKSLIFAMVIAILLVSACGLLISGCGKGSIVPSNCDFNKIHIDTHQFSGCIEITKHCCTVAGIEVSTTDGNYFFSEGTYFLVEDKCPICDKY